jgi:Iron-containing redox enzyme
LTVESYQSLDALEARVALKERAASDLNPPLSPDGQYLRQQMSFEGYRYLLAIASFDGLIEASRLSRILGGAANQVQATLTKVLLEEYGNGRLTHKHSTFFAQMLAELALSTQPEAYFSLVPWEVLASINHNFLLTERKQHFLRYNGGLAYFEIAGPVSYKHYLEAAQRLGLSKAAMGYWELHIKEDERHGRWMLEDVALPLVDLYPNDAWQIVWGYDQEKFMSDRAGAAVVRSIGQAEQSEPLPAVYV